MSLFSKRQEKGSFAFLDMNHTLYAKGVAILIILIGHLGNYSGVTWFTPLGGIGVAIFLFCSGYGLTLSYKKNGLSRYWWKKLVGVYLPFFMVEALASLILQRPFLDTLLSFIFIKRLSPYGWYMQYLFACYLLFWLGTKFIKHQKLRFSFFGAVAIASFFLFENLQGEQALSFFGGVLVGSALDLSKARAHLAGRKRFLLLISAALLCGGIALLAIKQMPFVRSQHHYIITLINSLMKSSFAAGLLSITALLSPLKCAVFFAGKLAYPLYLIHGYFMFFVYQNLCGGYLLSCAVAVALSFALSLVLHLTIGAIQAGIHKLTKRGT